MNFELSDMADYISPAWMRRLSPSMGTGTAFVRAAKGEVIHIGGSGVGGGALLGLSSIILNKSDIDAILALAESGHIENVD